MKGEMKGEMQGWHAGWHEGDNKGEKVKERVTYKHKRRLGNTCVSVEMKACPPFVLEFLPAINHVLNKLNKLITASFLLL